MLVRGSGGDLAVSVTGRSQIVRLIGVIAGVFALEGCAGSSAASSRDGLRENPDVITRAEITRTQAQTAYDAVRLLRPNFLRSRGVTSLTRQTTDEPVVYLDERRIGGLVTLRDMPVPLIFEIRYLSASEAQMKWGSGHPVGAVHVISSKNRPGT
jgi:hypothetical protein